MKITLNRNNFLEELLFVDSLVVKNTANEKYRFIHMFNEKGVLTFLTADNGLAFAKSTFTTDVEESFSFSVIPEKLIAILKAFTSETFNMSINDNKIIVSSGKSKYTFSTQDALKIYTESTDLEGSTDCNYILFKRAVEIASAFTKTSESTQYTLKVFEMKLSPTHISIRSSDGNKMVHSYLEDAVDDRNIIMNIDRDYVYVLDKLDRAERLKIQKYQNCLEFNSSNRTVKIMSKVGNFPNTDTVINNCKVSNDKSHTINNDVLLEPLKRISTILDGKIKKVKVIFGDKSIKMISEEHEEEIESSGTDEGAFSLNGQHLMDVLKHSGTSLKLNFSSEKDFAIYITDENNNHFVLGKTA
jgi:DNA polymerase III sliding clamp (beta) subunit (PCNA family)